jgi:hypothetical protein
MWVSRVHRCNEITLPGRRLKDGRFALDRIPTEGHAGGL